MVASNFVLFKLKKFKLEKHGPFLEFTMLGVRLTHGKLDGIRGVACSAKEKVSSGQTLAGRGPLGRKFLPFFYSAVVALVCVVKLT